MPLKYFYLGFKKAFDFKGITSRKEFGYFFLFDILFFLFLIFIDAVIFGYSFFSSIGSVLGIIPRLSIGIRRLRDAGKSVWWFFFPFPLPFWLWVCDVSIDQTKSSESNKSKSTNTDQNYKKDRFEKFTCISKICKN